MALNLLAPAVVRFRDASTPDEDITYRYWDFGNGNTATDTEEPDDQTYTDPGVYTVSLSVASPKGTDQHSDTVTVSAQAEQGEIAAQQWLTDGGTGDIILRMYITDPADPNLAGYYGEVSDATPLEDEVYVAATFGGAGATILSIRWLFTETLPAPGTVYTFTLTSVNTQGLRSLVPVTVLTGGSP